MTSEWKTTESAPKDKFILLFCSEDGTRWLARWQGNRWYGVDDQGFTHAYRVGTHTHNI